MNRRTVIAVAIMALLSTQTSPQIVKAQASKDWISPALAMQYADNLLETYNFDISQVYGSSPNATITHYFILYERPGYSFNVTVMHYENLTDNAAIAFVFYGPINAGAPVITMDNKSTACSVFAPGMPQLCPPFIPTNDLGIWVRQGFHTGVNGSGYPPSVWIANATTLYANPLGSSDQEAQKMFAGDQSTVPLPAKPDPIVQFIQAFWWLVIVVIGGIIGFVASVRYLYKDWWKPRQRRLKRLQAKRKAEADKENAKRDKEKGSH